MLTLTFKESRRTINRSRNRYKYHQERKIQPKYVTNYTSKGRRRTARDEYVKINQQKTTRKKKHRINAKRKRIYNTFFTREHEEKR